MYEIRVFAGEEVLSADRIFLRKGTSLRDKKDVYIHGP